MKLTLLVLALTLAANPATIAQTGDGFAHSSPRLYELYSWPQSNGIWNFCLLPSPSGVNIPVETIFNKKLRITGIGQLERKLSLLPTGARIIWLPGLTSGQTPNKESSKLALPPTETVEKVKLYATQHGIQMEVPKPSPLTPLSEDFVTDLTYVHVTTTAGGCNHRIFSHTGTRQLNIQTASSHTSAKLACQNPLRDRRIADGRSAIFCREPFDPSFINIKTRRTVSVFLRNSDNGVVRDAPVSVARCSRQNKRVTVLIPRSQKRVNKRV